MAKHRVAAVLRGIAPTLAMVIVAIIASGCTVPAVSPGGDAGPPAAAPTLKVGDRWVYSGKDGYRVAITWQETHEIAAMTADGITVKVTGQGSTGDFARTEAWTAPGVVRVGAVYESETERFDPALIRFKYPLTPGETWSQSIRDVDKPVGPYGPIQRQVTIGGYEKVTTPAGTFDALKMRIFMQLDDETFWRYPTQCNYLLWYAPAVGNWVRQEQRSYYRNKDINTGGAVPGQNATIELVSYQPAPR